jgi:hypothetical protein
MQALLCTLLGVGRPDTSQLQLPDKLTHASSALVQTRHHCQSAPTTCSPPPPSLLDTGCPRLSHCGRHLPQGQT